MYEDVSDLSCTFVFLTKFRWLNALRSQPVFTDHKIHNCDRFLKFISTITVIERQVHTLLSLQACILQQDRQYRKVCARRIIVMGATSMIGSSPAENDLAYGRCPADSRPFLHPAVLYRRLNLSQPWTCLLRSALYKKSRVT